MKKTSLALAGVMLAGSVVALTACDGGSVGKVNGNFKEEATKAQLEETLSNIDWDNAFAETNGASGFKIESNLKSVDKTIESYEGVKVTTTKEYGINFNYTMSVSSTADAYQSAGKGKASVDITNKMSVGGQSVKVSGKAKAELYNDENAIYFGYSLTGMGEEDIAEKYKISTQDILAFIQGIIGGEEDDEIDSETLASEEDGEEIEAPDSDGLDFAGYLDMIVAYGFTPYIDSSNGIKIKFSASEELVQSIYGDEDLGLTKDNFTSTVLDIYLVIDANGVFKQLSADVNVAYTVKSAYGEQSVSNKGGFCLSNYTGTVTLPEGIASDTSYKEIDLNEIFPGEQEDSIVGEYELYYCVINGEMYDVDDPGSNVTADTFTLTVREDGTLTMTNYLFRPFDATKDGVWRENEYADYDYIFTVGDNVYYVDYMYGTMYMDYGNDHIVLVK